MLRLSLATYLPITHRIFHFKLHSINSIFYVVKHCFARPYARYVGDSITNQYVDIMLLTNSNRLDSIEGVASGR